MRTFAFLLLLLCAPLLLSCGRTESAADDASLRIAASNPPLEWVARGLAPEGASVATLLPPGASEHGYEPPPSRLAAFVRADVVLMVGMGLEPAADRALRTTPRGGRTIVAFGDLPAIAAELAGSPEAHAGHDHAADDDDVHQHAPTDPHVWLVPDLMAGFVNAAHDAVARRMRRSNATEEEIDALRARRDGLLAEVAAVDAEYQERLAPFRGAAIVSGHDSVGRLADRSGLRIVGVLHTHGGAEPTPDAVMEAADSLRAAKHRAILVEPQMAGALGERLSRQTGAPLAAFDPLGSGDWAQMMRTNLDALVAAFESP
ncbi:MAG: metal ABC transporter substrate-binding protein [Phycisphaerales bacterium]